MSWWGGAGGTNLKHNRVILSNQDLNDDRRYRGEEVSCLKGDTLMLNFRGDFSAVTGSGLLFRPSRFTAGGRRCLRWGKSVSFVEGTQRPVSSGGGGAVMGSDGQFVMTNAPSR